MLGVVFWQISTLGAIMSEEKIYTRQIRHRMFTGLMHMLLDYETMGTWLVNYAMPANDNYQTDFEVNYAIT